MLVYLEIKNYIFIDQLKLEPSTGLNIFTGETGAGKSILLETISLLCGEKPEVPVVGQSNDKCILVGIFDVQKIKDYLNELLQETDIEINEQLVIRREFDTQNRSKCFINDKPVSVNLLKTIGDTLLDIHGQNQHQKLLTSSHQIFVLDRYANLENKIKEYRTKYLNYKKLLQQKESLLNELNTNKQKIDLLSYQINEIEQAKLTDEDEIIETELEKAKNAQKVINILGEIKFNLQEINQKINAIQKMWQSLAGFIKNIEHINLDNSIAELDKIFDKVEEYKKTFSNYTTEYVDSLIDRVDLIKKLKRKYGNSIEEIKKYYQQAKQQLQQININSEQFEKLQQDIEKTENELIELATEISKIRIKTAKQLQQEINKEFESLGLQKAKININVTTENMQKENLSITGFDKIEFLVSTNPSTPFFPLKDVASGGELSRIMLAIKTVLGRKEETPILIFDEIDSGVGGPMGFTIGKKLKQLSLQNKQIFCITHLPQIACFADKHFIVRKQQFKNKTVVDVETLHENEKIEELARMLSGSKIDETSLNHAKKLLKEANESIK